MNFRNPGSILGAAALAIILLLLFQVQWLRESQKLVEEQFDQKVTMALCSAIEELGDQADPIDIDFTCAPTLNSCSTTAIRTNVGSDELETVLSTTLQRYQIDLGFEFDVIPVGDFGPSKAVYCSSMQPLTKEEDHTLRVQFMGKQAYVMQELGFMAGSSILLLLLLCSLFGLTLFRFVQQKRLNAVAVDAFNNMAHEFRTPITNIGLALNRLKKQQGESKYARIIEAESQRLHKQIECMLHVAKLDQGDYELEKEDLQLAELIQEVMEDMAFRLEEKEGHISFHTTPGLPMIWGDRLHLSNVFRNLIENAIKYSATPAQVEVSLSANAGDVVLQFRDQGIGMNETEAKSAFEPFAQSDKKKKGFGLGLYYARQIVERHCGRIYLKSQPGVGSTFTIHLPAK